MKQLLVVISLMFLLSASCSKDGKGCWRGYDGFLVQTGVFCDKTKEEAKSMPYTAFVCPADEKKYCWVLSNNVHYSCIPQTIIEDFCRPQGLTFTKENCSGICRYKRLDKNLNNMIIQNAGNCGISKLVFDRPPAINFFKEVCQFQETNHKKTGYEKNTYTICCNIFYS